jgi:hypothetical protein
MSVEGLSEEQRQCLVRCEPIEDSTNGFFVACFVRDVPPLYSVNPLRTIGTPTSSTVTRPRKRRRLNVQQLRKSFMS